MLNTRCQESCRSKLGSTNINGSIQMNIQTGILAVITRSGERWSVFGSTLVCLQWEIATLIASVRSSRTRLLRAKGVKDATVEGMQALRDALCGRRFFQLYLCKNEDHDLEEEGWC